MTLQHAIKAVIQLGDISGYVKECLVMATHEQVRNSKLVNCHAPSRDDKQLTQFNILEKS